MAGNEAELDPTKRTKISREKKGLITSLGRNTGGHILGQCSEAVIS